MGVAQAGLRAFQRLRLPSPAMLLQITVLLVQLAGAAAFVAGVALLSAPAGFMVGGVLAVLVTERFVMVTASEDERA